MLPLESNVAAFAGLYRFGRSWKIDDLLRRYAERRPIAGQVQGQAVRCAPVVLNIGSVGDVVPLTGNFHCIFGVLLGKTKQIVCKVIARETAVKGERALLLAKASWVFL